MAKGPVKSGDGQIGRPQQGQQGPNDKGQGTRHRPHPNPPTPVRTGVSPGKR